MSFVDNYSYPIYVLISVAHAGKSPREVDLVEGTIRSFNLQSSFPEESEPALGTAI